MNNNKTEQRQEERTKNNGSGGGLHQELESFPFSLLTRMDMLVSALAGGRRYSTARWLLLKFGFLLLAIFVSLFCLGGLRRIIRPPAIFSTSEQTSNIGTIGIFGDKQKSTEAFTTTRKEDDDEVEVAWLMSFGGSGTSYTIMNTESMTQTTTATNYGRDLNPCVGVHSNWTNGPFLHNTKMNLPPRYVLSKTHCGGYCMDCRPKDYALSVEDFTAACLTGGKRIEPQQQQQQESKSTTDASTAVTYDASIPRKALHVVRSPFDNLVARMHLGIKRGERLGRNVTSTLEYSPAGFAEWCRYLDTKHENDDESMLPALLKKYESLPCRQEWFRFVNWHNRVDQVTTNLKLPVRYLYFENYTTAWNETVSQLLDFLQFDDKARLNGDPVPFVPGKTYKDYYRPEDARRAAQMVEELATPKVWALLKHYFPMRPSSESKGDQRGNHNGEKTEVAWLLSFPNSGTSYTVTNTQFVSNASTATNYADFQSLVPVRPELADNGPFLRNSNLQLSSFTLTKTHCAGYCVDCKPHDYVHTVESFQRGCLSGFKSVNGKHIKTSYEATVPSRAVHLIRNPFDNIVARVHWALRLNKTTDPDFDLWCHEMDSMFPLKESETSLISSEVKEMWKELPCHSDWYRWTQWHNLTLAVTKRLKLPTHYLYYEDYEDYDRTLNNTFEFLGLPIVNKPFPFLRGKTYLYLFDEHTIRAAARFVQAVASPECWELVKRYFDIEGIRT